MPLPVVILLYSLLLLFLAFLAVIIGRTLAFRPKSDIIPDDSAVEFDKTAPTETLRQLIRCATVSYRDPAKEDDAEFQKLVSILPTLFPAVFRVCEYTELPDRALLFRWKGKSGGAPAVLMAHYDVVPAEASAWEKPPFEAILEDGVLWGRGTLDTKVTFNAILFAANRLVEEGFTPENDIYFAFSGGEEVNGKGAVRIVDYFEEKGITPAYVLDEGGAVVEKVFPGVSTPAAMIGIAEKGMLDLEYRVKSGGGHASAPPPHTPVGVLSESCRRVEGHPFPSHLTPPVRKMFDTLGRHSTFLYRMIFANLFLFSWVLDLLAKKTGGEMNALLRTTVAFTQMQGSSASNVIPPEASMVSNIRLNPCDTVESAAEYIRKTVANERVEVKVLHGMNPSRISTTECDGYKKVASAVVSTWRGCIATPYLMVQCSDSRHYGRISDRVYRFSAMALTAEERRTIHGNNERIRVEAIAEACEFYIRLMKNS